MEENLEVVSFVKILSIGVFAGTAAFLFMPFILTGVISLFLASLMGVAITMPLMVYYLQVPATGFDLGKYYRERRIYGVVADLLMTILSAYAPGLIFLYGLVGMGFMPPVPVAFSAAVAVFTGYSAFLYRNRKFYREERIDIEL